MVQRQRSCLAKFGWMSHRFMDLCKLSRQCKFFSYCLGTPLIRWWVANSNRLSHTRNSGCDSNRLTTACGRHIPCLWIPPSYIWHAYTRTTSQWGWYSDYTCYSRCPRCSISMWLDNSNRTSFSFLMLSMTVSMPGVPHQDNGIKSRSNKSLA